VDKQVLFKRKAKAATDTVTIDGDIELQIRALSRGEVEKARGGKPDNAVYERRLIAAALVDPVMTYEEVTLWLDGDPDDDEDEGAPAGDAVKVMTAIAELSGLTEDAQKSGVSGVRERRR
jgi:hypothetical protein